MSFYCDEILSSVITFYIVTLPMTYLLILLLVIRSVSDVLRAKSRFVKFVGGEATGRTPYTFYKPTWVRSTSAQ